MPSNENECACETCPGPECDCGCQGAQSEAQDECRCGQSCNCGPACACEVA